MIKTIAHGSTYIQRSSGITFRSLLHAGIQVYRTSIGLDSPAFQQHLKQLKLRLHPDRVATHPDARAANEQSFKILSQYLEDLRGDGGNPAEQYRLDFYVKRDSQTLPGWQDLTTNESTLHASSRLMQDPRYWQPGQERYEPPPQPAKQKPSRDIGNQNSSQPNIEERKAIDPLRRLTIRLPPPPPQAASRLPAAVRSAFRRLFAALHLEDIFVDDDDTCTGDHSKREVAAAALADFLPDAIELARQGDAVRHGLPIQQVQSIHSAFWLSRRMRVTFDGAADAQPPLAHIASLEALARAIDRSSNGALRDCVVIIGEGAGLDVLGRVWLPFDREDTWPEVLAAVSVGLVRERKKHFERVCESEASAASAVGVSAVFTTHRLSLSASYVDFLQRLEEYGMRVGQVCGGDVAPLSVCAKPASDMPKMTLLHDTGVVQASVGSSAEDVATFLAANGPAVADALQRQQVAERGLRDLRRRVELRLRLQQLKRSPELSAAQFEKGCHRLLEHREFLMQYVEGSVIQLSGRNFIIPGQHVISIAWDFTV